MHTVSKRAKCLTILLGAQALLAACTDPKSATNANYKAVIQNYFEQRDDYPHCFFNYAFPAEFEGERQLNLSGVKNKLKLLHELGLLEYKTETIGESYGRPKTIYGFNPTDLGRQYYTAENGFCIGKPELLDLHNISEPYEERGRTYVNGSYTWTVNLPDWAKDPVFYKSKQFSTQLIYIRFEKIMKGEPKEEYFTLTLNDDGWSL